MFWCCGCLRFCTGLPGLHYRNNTSWKIKPDFPKKAKMKFSRETQTRSLYVVLVNNKRYSFWGNFGTWTHLFGLDKIWLGFLGREPRLLIIAKEFQDIFSQVLKLEIPGVHLGLQLHSKKPKYCLLLWAWNTLIT